MIAHLSGRVIARRDNFLVVDVGGVGYGVNVSTYTYGKTLHEDAVALFVHTYVREQEIALYGFIGEEERVLFDALLTISGVGPKAALGILSVADPQTIVRAIASQDARILTRVSGIGQKKAQRIVLELQNKVKDLIAQLPAEEDAREATADMDVLDALTGMGYSAAEARDALAATADEADVARRITRALQYLGKR